VETTKPALVQQLRGVVPSSEPLIEERVASSDGGLYIICNQDRIPCQICREKEQPMIRWCIVSVARSHRRHLGLYWSPCFTILSFVQQTYIGKPVKKLNMGDARLFQMSFTYVQFVEPWNEVGYADLAVYSPLAFHFQISLLSSMDNVVCSMRR
jgi:hypothetical protein